MNNNIALEAYLSKLDRALAPLSVSDRAEILLEIKSHVLSAEERDPNQPIDALLAALGEPETVANRYLLERGKAPVKPPISPMVKWLVIGFVGSLALLLFFVGAVLWKLSPILHVDEKNGRVQILGGLIDVDEKSGNVRIGPGRISGSFEINGDWPGWNGIEDEIKFSGTQTVDQAHRKIQLRFSNGKLEFTTSKNAAMAWQCAGGPHRDPMPRPEMKPDSILFDLSNLHGVRCEVQVPKDAELGLDGMNGKVIILSPAFHLDARITNAKIGIKPASTLEYNYDLKVMNGKVGEFTSSDNPSAYRMKVNATNAKISREE